MVNNSWIDFKCLNNYQKHWCKNYKTINVFEWKEEKQAQHNAPMMLDVY